MSTKKIIYPIKIQKEIIKRAKKTILGRYGKDASVLAIYLGGTALNHQLGIYDKSTHDEAVPRDASDIDVFIVINNLRKWLPLSKENQKLYGVRHI